MKWKAKNIWFRCPACDGKLVVAASAGGCRANCPECATDIPIPARSTMAPSWVRQGVVYATQALLVIAAVGAGTWWALRTEQSGDVTGVKKPSSEQRSLTAQKSSDVVSEDELQAAREEKRQLEIDHEDLQGRYAKMTQWMLENYRGKYPLPERLVRRLRIDPVTDTGEVSSDLVEILKLTSEEKTIVEEIIKSVRDAMKQTERDLVRLVEQTDLRVSYEVPVFPEAGLPLRDGLYENLESALGAPRFDRLLDVAGESLREKLNYFGEASRNLSFEIILPEEGSGQSPYLLIRDGWMIPEGDSVRLTKVKETAVVELPESYREYSDWVPEGFGAYTLQ